MGAAVVDWGLGILVVFSLGFVLGLTGHEDADVDTVAAVSLLAWWLTTFVVFAGIFDGQSVGKRLARIRVVRDNGERYGIAMAFVREVVCRVIWLIPLVALVDVLMPLGAERRSVRDRMAGTRVMRERAYRARRWPLAIAATALIAIWGVFAALDDGSASSTSSPAASPAADYTAADRLAFVKGCAETGEFSRTECGCAFDRIRQRLSYAEFREADRQDEDKWSPRVNRALRDAFRACARDSADTNPA